MTTDLDAADGEAANIAAVRWPVPALAVEIAAAIGFVDYSRYQLRVNSASLRVQQDRPALQKQPGWSRLARRLSDQACSELPVRTAPVWQHLLQPALQQRHLPPVSQRRSHQACS